MINFVTALVMCASLLMGAQVSVAPETKVGGLFIGMQEQELLASKHKLDRGFVSLEGDDYVQYSMHLDTGVKWLATLDHEARVFEIATSSYTYRDANGVGIGSQLIDVKRMYPQGQLIGGEADGPYLNYVVQSGERMAVFSFDAASVTENCLFDVEGCEVLLSSMKVYRYFVR